MADGDTTLDDDGDEVLDFDGDLFLEKTVGDANPCNCYLCVNALDCTRCYGNFQYPSNSPTTTQAPWCCYECTPTIDVTFGTFTLAGGASGKPFYDVAVDLIAMISGQTVALNRVTDASTGGGAEFRAYGLISQAQSGNAYAWGIWLSPTNWMNPTSGNLRDVRWQMTVSVVQGPWSTMCIGDSFPACPTGKTLSALAETVSLMTITSWRGDCCSTFDPQTPTTINADYFSAVDDVEAFSVTACSSCSTSSLPSTVAIDSSEFLNTCWSFTGTFAVPLMDNGIAYGDSNSGQIAGPGLVPGGYLMDNFSDGTFIYDLFYFLYYLPAYADVSSGCILNLVLTVKKELIAFPFTKTYCQKVYEKTSTLDDPTGVYTLVGGSETVTVT